MEYRRVGNSGLKVSALSLGSWLTIGDKLDQHTAGQIVDTAISNGINLFDVADGYANGAAEQHLGGLLKPYNRSQVVISSKVFWPTGDSPNERGLSRKHIMASIERSLSNLSTDYLDIYFCHREDPDTPIEETVMAMDNLIRQGKALYWGTSMWSIRSLKKAISFARKNGLHAPIAEQPPYNLLERWVEKKTTAYRRLGIGLLTWSPLAGGILTAKYIHQTPPGSRGSTSDWLDKHLNPSTQQTIKQFEQLAEELNVLPNQLALAWLLNNPAVSSIITGATTATQLQSNIGAGGIRLDPATQRRLLKLFPR